MGESRKFIKEVQEAIDFVEPNEKYLRTHDILTGNKSLTWELMKFYDIKSIRFSFEFDPEDLSTVGRIILNPEKSEKQGQTPSELLELIAYETDEDMTYERVRENMSIQDYPDFKSNFWILGIGICGSLGLASLGIALVSAIDPNVSERGALPTGLGLSALAAYIMKKGDKSRKEYYNDVLKDKYKSILEFQNLYQKASQLDNLVSSYNGVFEI